MAEPNSTDPVLVRRAQMARLAHLGQRVGCGLLGVAVIAFFVGLLTSLDTWGTIVVVCLALTTVTLAPAIVLGYAVRAAAREDAERSR